MEELQGAAEALRTDVQALHQRVQLLEGRLDNVEDHNGKTLQLLKGQAEALDEQTARLSIASEAVARLADGRVDQALARTLRSRSPIPGTPKGTCF